MAVASPIVAAARLTAGGSSMRFCTWCEPVASEGCCPGISQNSPGGRQEIDSHGGDCRQSIDSHAEGDEERGYNAAKKITGRKRHLAVDTLGLLLAIVVHEADWQIKREPNE